MNAWTDAALMQGAGIPTVLIGSAGGNYHAPDEWASIPELVQLSEIVVEAAKGSAASQRAKAPASHRVRLRAGRSTSTEADLDHRRPT